MTIWLRSDILVSQIQNGREMILNVHSNSMLCREYGLLCVGISCLQLFVQNNWVGPPSASPADSLMSRAHNVEKVIPTL